MKKKDRVITGKDSVLFIKGIPKELKDRFHAHCARRGKSMTDTVVSFMRSVIKEESSTANRL